LEKLQVSLSTALCVFVFGSVLSAADAPSADRIHLGLMLTFVVCNFSCLRRYAKIEIGAIVVSIR